MTARLFHHVMRMTMPQGAALELRGLRGSQYCPSAGLRLAVPYSSCCILLKVQGKGRACSLTRTGAWPHKRQMADQSLEDRKAVSEREYEGYRKHFPQVADLAVSELHELLERDPDGVVLIDVRTPEERAVSQLPGQVVTVQEYESRKEEFKNKLAVCYCTAGMRSGKQAAKFHAEGIDTKNLKGSIVAWTQQSYPMVKGDGSKEPTKRVHAFGNQWAVQMGDGYEVETFNKAKGAFEISRTVLPTWLGGNK